VSGQLYKKWEKEYEEIMSYHKGARIVAYLEREEARGKMVPVLICFESRVDGRIRYFQSWRTLKGDILSETIGFTEVVR
jgi:hypothetical protein